MAEKIRAFGWIQNPALFSNLKKVVQLFDSNSPHYQWVLTEGVYIIPNATIQEKLLQKLKNSTVTFSYTELVGRSTDANGKSVKSRTDAVADALIQISIPSQKSKTTGKNWTDNWTADGYLRWAVSLGLVQMNRESDTFKITALGQDFSALIPDSDDELNFLRQVLLGYPPACRILNLLAENTGQPVSKFYLGSRLGFVGEKGFTSYSESMMLSWLNSNLGREERNKIRSDVEGTSDKYARGICSWLEKVGFVTSCKNAVNLGKDNYGFNGYEITGMGLSALRRSQGSSKNQANTKFLTWEFLANDGVNREYLRTRRAYILKNLQKSNKISTILANMKELGYVESWAVLEADIAGLVNFGLRIEIRHDRNEVVLHDRLCDFDIPKSQLTAKQKDVALDLLKNKFIEQTDIPHKYLSLIELSRNKKAAIDFEILTMDLFANIYKLGAKHLGGTSKPDGVVYLNQDGVIVDTKAYKDGYGKNISEGDKMLRYVVDAQKQDVIRQPNEWWLYFPNEVDKQKVKFLWISSFFKAGFDEQIRYVARETCSLGAAINVEQLLWGAHAVHIGEMEASSLFNMFNNEEIVFRHAV